MKRKICNKCKINKELKEFYKKENKTDGFVTICKKCILSYAKMYRESHKEKIKKELKLYYLKNKLELRKKHKIYAKNHKREKREIVQKEWLLTILFLYKVKLYPVFIF